MVSLAFTDDELLALVQEELGDEPVSEDGPIADDLSGLRLRNDNVAVRLRARAATTDSGIVLARPRKVPCSQCSQKGKASCPLCHGSMRMLNPHVDPLVEADVLAVGPGYYTKDGAFVPQELKVGDVVLVQEDAGDSLRYSHDVRIVRAGSDWLGEGGSYRPGEIFGVVEC